MKLLSFEVDGSRRFGGWVEGGIVDLSRRLGGQFPELLSVLQAGALPVLAAALKDAKPRRLRRPRHFPAGDPESAKNHLHRHQLRGAPRGNRA